MAIGPPVRQLPAGRPRGFDRVIVESISRLSRNSSVAFRVEDELRAAGVRLCCADEPLEESFGTIVLRHVNIGIARGYHHELMVKSRQGLETSTRQGWHTGGIAAYGYRFVEHDHPNPHKAARGQRKRTLDPDRYPPPTCVDPARALEAWSRSSVWEILRNPKYTGYQVWNRRARKTAGNRDNPPEAWIWSEEPAHPPVVSKEEFEAVAARAAANRGSRQGAAPTSHQYRTGESCAAASAGFGCGGTTAEAPPTTAASPPISARPTSRPAIRRTCTSVSRLFTRPWWGSFRPHCSAPSVRRTGAVVSPTARASSRPLPSASAPRRSTEVADLERRIERQIANLEAEDATPALRRRIAARIAELEEAVEDRRRRAAALAQEVADAPPTAADLATALDQLPLLDRLPELPQPELRTLFDSLRLQVAFQPADAAVDVEVALFADDPSDRRKEVAEVQSVPPAGIEPATHGLGNRCSI